MPGGSRHDNVPSANRRQLLAGAAALGGGLMARPLLGTQPAEAAAHGARRGNTGTSVTRVDGPYQPTVESLSEHPLPRWFQSAKFGIFIHWGVFSVPAWAPVGKEYAEWYWQQMHDPKDPTYQHQLQTYGAESTYDDFIAKFTASRYDPAAWVRLIERAGAKYFVSVTKHHDGIALFDSKYSNRTTTKLGPHRDLLRELFDAAARDTPHLKRGTYYSLPEWYNPAYPGHGSSFPGGKPKQYVTGKTLPYTGYVPVHDYVNDFQVKQMRELISRYDTDILWGDIGGPNNSLPVMADYYNQALGRRHPKEVVVNDRLGVDVYDFTTPEYDDSASFHKKKWEACRGIDPHSFGYNAATPTSEYASAEELVQQLVDTVAKNGNFLLDIGPKADGTLPEVMTERLEAIGDWLRINGEAIYDSTYWSHAQEEGDIRFTRTSGRFHMITLGWPGNTLEVSAPVPVSADTHVRLLGHDGPPLPWTRRDGKLVVTLPSSGAAATRSRYAYTFSFDVRDG